MTESPIEPTGHHDSPKDGDSGLSGVEVKGDGACGTTGRGVRGRDGIRI